MGGFSLYEPPVGWLRSFPMNREMILKLLREYSKLTGVPVKELNRMCLQAGMELLEQGELRVSLEREARAGRVEK